MSKFISDEEMAELEKKPTSKKKKKFISDAEMAKAAPLPEDVEEPEIALTVPEVARTAAQGVTSWADELEAGARTALQIGGGRKTPFMDLYEEEVAPIRKDVAMAREKAPWKAAGIEAAAGLGTAFVPGLGAGKMGSALGTVGRAAFEGLGTAEDKASWEGVTQAGIGGALGAAGALVSGGLKKLNAINPMEERAAVLGARTAEFKEIGIKEREKIADELNKMGLFSKQKVDFDPDKMSFVPKGKSIENLEKPVRTVLLDRLDEATSKIQDKKMKVLGKFANDPVNLQDFEDYLESAAQAFAKKGTDRAGRLQDAQKIKQTIIDDIMAEWEETQGMTPVTLSMIENAKKRLSDDVSNFGKNPLVAKTPYQADIYNNFYTSINKKLRSMVGDNKYAQFNDAQQKLLTAKSDLVKAMASDSAQKASMGLGNPLNRLGNNVMSSEEFGLGMARAKEIADLPVLRQGASALRTLTPELPYSAIRQLDPSMPQVEIPFAPEEPQQESNMFNKTQQAFPFGVTPEEQIRKLPGSSSMINPREIINFRIPRTTDGILENKDRVIAKLAQNGIPDEMLYTVAQALDGDRDTLADIAPLLTTQFPTLFEKSKYKVFDGVIVDAADKARIADAISKRKDLDSITRARAINDVNLSGKYPEGLV